VVVFFFNAKKGFSLAQAISKSGTKWAKFLLRCWTATIHL